LVRKPCWLPKASGSLKQKRDIDIKMCGATLRVEAKSASTEWAMRLAGRLKRESLGKDKGLPTMVHEEWILELPPKGTVCSISQEVLKDMPGARECAMDMLKRAELTCLADIGKAPMKKQHVPSLFVAQAAPHPCQIVI